MKLVCGHCLMPEPRPLTITLCLPSHWLLRQARCRVPGGEGGGDTGAASGARKAFILHGVRSPVLCPTKLQKQQQPMELSARDCKWMEPKVAGVGQAWTHLPRRTPRLGVPPMAADMSPSSGRLLIGICFPPALPQEPLITRLSPPLLPGSCQTPLSPVTTLLCETFTRLCMPCPPATSSGKPPQISPVRTDACLHRALSSVWSPSLP